MLKKTNHSPVTRVVWNTELAEALSSLDVLRSGPGASLEMLLWQWHSLTCSQVTVSGRGRLQLPSHSTAQE